MSSILMTCILMTCILFSNRGLWNTELFENLKEKMFYRATSATLCADPSPPLVLDFVMVLPVANTTTAFVEEKLFLCALFPII